MNRAEIGDFVKDIDSALHTGPVFGASEEFLAELLLDAQALAEQLLEAMTALEDISNEYPLDSRSVIPAMARRVLSRWEAP